MKILHYLNETRLELGGVVRAVLDICALLAERGHDVTLATYDPQDIPEAWRGSEADTPRVVVLDRPSLPGALFGRAGMERFRELIRDANALHMHIVWIPSNVQVASAAYKLGVPYFITTHGMLDDWSMAQRSLKKKAHLALVGNRMFRRAAGVHCTASAEAEQTGQWVPKDKITIIPYVFDLDPFQTLPGVEEARAAYNIDDEQRVVLFLSRIHEKKGIEHLIDAVGLLRDRGEDCRVLIAGTGEPTYVSSLHARLKDQQLEDRVEFLGLVTDTKKISLYQAADLFVLPTSQENFGFVLVEALAAETSVVTTKGVDIWPELEESGGAVIETQNPSALADRIAELLADPDRLAAMGRSGREWVFANLNGAAVVERFERLYQDAIQTPPTSRQSTG